MAELKITTSKAITNLTKVTQELIELKKQSVLTGLESAESLKKISTTLDEIRRANAKAQASLKSLSSQVNKNSSTTKKNTTAKSKNSNQTKKQTSQTKKNTVAVKKNNTSVKKSTSLIKGLTVSTYSLMSAFGIVTGIRLFADILKNVYNLTKEFDSLKFTLQSIVDTNFDLASSQRFLLKISEEYGVELLTTSKRYVKFLAAAKQSNLSLADTEKIFASATKASSVLALKTDELTGVYLALEQMLSKGKVTTEELRRQLGERLPGAMGIMATALDVSIPKLDLMLKKGEVMSAEALPKFAEALELAYGTASKEKIDNLATAQNRLASTWQTFVQDLSEGGNVLNEVFKNGIEYITEFIKKISSITESPALKLQRQIIEDEKNLNALLDLESKEMYSKKIGNLQDFEKRKQQLHKISLFKYSSMTKEEKKVHDENIRKVLSDEKKQQKVLDSFKKEIAQSRISSATTVYLAQKENYDKEMLTLEKLKRKLKETSKEHAKTGNWLSDMWDTEELAERQKIIDSIDKQKQKISEISVSYSLATANFDTYRKLLQVSNLQTIIDPKKASVINTDELDLEITKLKGSIKDIENFMEGFDSLSFNNNNQMMEAIKDLFQKKNELIEAQFKKEIKLSRENAIKKEIAEEVQHQKEKDLLVEAQKKKQDVLAKFFSSQLNEIRDYNESLLNENKIRINNEFKQIINPSLDQRKKYLKDLKENERKYNNLTKNKQADFIENWLDDLKIFGKDRVELKRKILKLLASLEVEYNEKDTKDKEKHFRNQLQKIEDFISEASNLFDAFSQRRLESIDAEINAEEKKYDKLITLAENDASKKESLERQKQARIEALEKKRLKEEQRQAKIRKMFALSDIAINTAIGYSKALAQGGFVLGIPMAKVILGLGLLQAATVLATPIPQYAEGIESVPNDQVAMINDGGQKEYVKRDGEILSTDSKNAIVNLKKGDRVYKNKKEMQKNENIYAYRSNSLAIKKIKEEQLSKTITSAIKKGFKDAKITNTIKLADRKNHYLNKKSRFNG